MAASSLPLCTVMLLDFADAEGAPPQNPAVLKKQVHGLLGTALRGLPQHSRLAVESGSAAVVCFVGDPEDALHAALLLRDQVLHRYSGQLAVRVALTMGTVDVAIDPGDQLRVTGEAIHHASEVKDRARPNEVLASRSYHQLLSHLNPGRAGRFVDHQPDDPQCAKLYAAPSLAASAQSQPAPARDLTAPAPLFQSGPLDELVVQEIQRELTGHIGPMASALVRKVGRRAASAQDLRDTLAAAIADPDARRAFQSAAPAQSAALAPGDAAGPAWTHGGSDSTRHVDIAPTELAIIEHTLRRFVGPMAPPLMQREIEFCSQFHDFVQALAAGIGHPQQRAVFLQALQRALPERQIAPPISG